MTIHDLTPLHIVLAALAIALLGLALAFLADWPVRERWDPEDVISALPYQGSKEKQ